MNYKFLPFAIGMMLATASVNAESFESLSADEANFENATITDRLNVKGNIYMSIPKGTSRESDFIHCVDSRIPSYNTMFYVSSDGRVGATGIRLMQDSPMHCCTPSLIINYDKTNSCYQFNTSSNPGGPGERYIDMKFYAKSYEFNKGDMVVNGKITCKDELNVTALNASSIKAEDINVNMSNVADYVFDENYNLKSLSEVESYVNEHKHLPGIPSAAEIEQNGVSLSKMSNMLLEKVEELTLHMIRLEKENAALKAKYESLEK